MQSARGLSAPRRVFQPRPGLKLHDKTEFELIQDLRGSGWSWQLWVPRSKRRRGADEALVAYSLGEPKIWFSTAAVPPRSYLLALLQVQEPSQRVWCPVHLNFGTLISPVRRLHAASTEPWHLGAARPLLIMLDLALAGRIPFAIQMVKCPCGQTYHVRPMRLEGSTTSLSHKISQPLACSSV